MTAWLDSISTACPVEELTLWKAANLAVFATSHGPEYGVHFVETRKTAKNVEIVVVEIDVDRPQDRKFDIKRREPIAVLAPPSDRFLSVIALREDFPHTPHRNWVPKGMPRSLCVDDRPWQEARLTWSPAECVRRIRQWLAKAARGELHDPAQPLEPFFYSSGYKLILPRAIIEHADTGDATRLIGTVQEGGDLSVFIARADDVAFKNTKSKGRMAILPFVFPDQVMAGIRDLPETLGELVSMATDLGVDIMGDLRKRLANWVGWKSGEFDSLSAHLVICIIGKVTDPGTSRSVLDARAFFVTRTAGEVGIEVGSLLPARDSGVKGTKSYVAAVPADKSKTGSGIRIEPMDIYLDFDRALGAEISGCGKPDERKVTMVGAGAIGSHIALMLAREGAFRWTVVDKDTLLPHNLARHGLPRLYVGYHKAASLAHQIEDILNEDGAATAIVADCLEPSEQEAAELAKAFGVADEIIDASASIAVSRHLSDLPDAAARRMSTFFNPRGTAVVLLAEGKDRSISLREIEAQYYNVILTTRELKDHLATQAGVRYSGSCRTLTNRIPERSAAILSGVVAGGIKRQLDLEAGGINIWSLGDDGGIRALHFDLLPPLRRLLGEWTVTVDGRLATQLRQDRQEQLPSETGGVLLGIVDFERRAIHVAHALTAPPDSQGSAAGFERGVQGLESGIEEACKTVMHQIRYVGEWHSHPKGATAAPSTTDIGQMCWLSVGLVSEGCPAVVLIVGEKDETVNLAMALEVAE